MPVFTYREAIRHALAEELARDPNVVVLGEEVAQFNGAYKVTEGLLEKFGPTRIVDTPISEAGFIGMGLGASMLGVRPVMELMFWSFYSVAFDQILNNAADFAEASPFPTTDDIQKDVYWESDNPTERKSQGRLFFD